MRLLYFSTVGFLLFSFLSVAFPARPYIRLPQPVPISKGRRGGCYLKYDPFENSSHVGPPGRQNSSHSNSEQLFGKLKAGLKCTIFQVHCIKISCKLAPTVRRSRFLFGSFCYFSIIVTLKLYNFYTVQDRGIQSAYEMLCMKRAFQTCIVRSGSPSLVSPMSPNMLHF